MGGGLFACVLHLFACLVLLLVPITTVDQTTNRKGGNKAKMDQGNQRLRENECQRGMRGGRMLLVVAVICCSLVVVVVLPLVVTVVVPFASLIDKGKKRARKKKKKKKKKKKDTSKEEAWKQHCLIRHVDTSTHFIMSLSHRLRLCLSFLFSSAHDPSHVFFQQPKPPQQGAAPAWMGAGV